MKSSLVLENMSTSEKLLAIETIWDDLMRNSSDIPSPAWHKDVLNARAQRLENNETKFSDWANAKQQLREKLNENQNT